MSWYRIVVIFSIVLFSHVSARELMPVSDDELIIRGLLYDEYKAYEDSRQVYAHLFDRTAAEVYLFREATASLMGKTNIIKSIKRLKAWDLLHPDRLEVKRLLIPLFLTANELTLAKTEAKYLVERSKKPIDLELASDPFLYAGEFKRALVLLNKVYAINHQETVLLRMADIMDTYTGERKYAIQLLETHRRLNISSNDVLVKLLVLYSEEEDVNGLMEIYKALYENTKDEKVLTKLIDIYAYTRDIDGAIAFLEKYEAGEAILYELYKNKKLFAKALVLLDSFYAKDADPSWLAEKGILLSESVENNEDKKMLDTIVSLFDKAMALGVDDSIYLNYYGYILIDKNVDIDKGMKIIENALVQQPDNTYYLDSLAWGYYKKHECKKAFKYMKRVVDEEGLKQDEIITHWHAIKQCK